MGIIKIKKQASEMIFIHKYPIYDDASLSFKAKGILTYLVGHSNNWETRVEDLEKHSMDGKASIRAGLEELRSSGYAKLTEVREKGKYVDWDWEVCEMPIFQEEATAFNAKQAQKVKTRKATPKKPVNQASQPDSDFRILDTKPSPDAENRNLVKHRKKPVNQASQPDSDFPEVVNRYYTNLRKNETKKERIDDDREIENTAKPEQQSSSKSSSSKLSSDFQTQKEKWGLSERWMLAQIETYGVTAQELDAFCGEAAGYCQRQGKQAKTNDLQCLIKSYLEKGRVPTGKDISVSVDPASVVAPARTTKTNPALWNLAFFELEKRINRPSFNTWIRPIRWGGWNGKVTLIVPEDYITGYLCDHFGNVICDVLKTLTNEAVTPDDFDFEVMDHHEGRGAETQKAASPAEEQPAPSQQKESKREIPHFRTKPVVEKRPVNIAERNRLLAKQLLQNPTL